MREIPAQRITDVVRDLFIDANTGLNPDMIDALEAARKDEESSIGREVLSEILRNAEIASSQKTPLCQDTGLAVLFVELGQEVHITGGDFNQAVEEGVRRAYREGYLRKSSCHPFSRENTGDNTPAIIHLRVVSGDRIRIVAVPKGGGSENMSQVVMLTPAAGKEGVVEFVVERVRDSGSNPCPPLIVGVGIGGTFEKAAELAKEALLRPVGRHHPDPETEELERQLLREINRLGIGPQGYGGRITALAVHVETFPCHIASLPVAVNLQCHANRHREAVI